MSLTVCTVHADVIQGLYRAKVAVGDQSARAQERAIQQTFRDVMVKVSGSRELLNEPVIKNSITNAGQYLRQYQFDVVEQQLYFAAEFDESKVDKLLTDAGLPIWGSYRPSVILWIADENPRLQKILHTEYSQSELKTALQAASERRGLSVNFPIDDLSDNSISVYDVWGRFSDNIIAASDRYEPEVVMSARMYPQREMTKEFEVQVPDSYLSLDELEAKRQREQERAQAATNALTNEDEQSGWQADWFIAYRDKFIKQSYQATDKNQLAAMLIDALADELANTFAVKTRFDSTTTQSASTFITLNNIDSISAYVDAQQYFESLQAVNDIQLRTLKGFQAVFQVILAGQEQDLINTLRLDDKVQRVTDAFGRPTPELEFVWTP